MYRETHSTPTERNTSPSPARIAWYAMRVVCSDDEQNRFTVQPGVSRRARIEIARPRLKPCSPAGWAQPQTRSSIIARSSWGSLSSTLPVT